MEAAIAQIEAEGAQALNLSKLARQLGVSQPAVYRHFSNKQALVFCLVERGFELLIQALQQATDAVAASTSDSQDDDSLVRLQAIVAAYVAFALEHTELARLMFSLKERATDPALYKISKQAALPLFQLVEDVQQRNGVKDEDAGQAVRLMWATMHGLAMLLMDEQLPGVTQTPGQVAVHVEAIARMLHGGLFET